MTHPAPDTSGVLVLRRPPAVEARSLTSIDTRILMARILVIGMSVLAVALPELEIASSVLLEGPSSVGGDGLVGLLGGWNMIVIVICFLINAAGQGLVLRDLLRRRKMERAFLGMELVFSQDGVAYRGPAGSFPAAWTAVRRIAIRRRTLIMEVDGWGGPLAELRKDGGSCELRIPVDGLGVDQATITRAVAELSSGRVSVTRR